MQNKPAVRDDQAYRELVKKIKGTNLLALPQSAAKVLELCKNPANGPPEVAVPIAADMGLTAQVLKFVNSSFFGFRNKITTVQTAISLVCVRTVRNFVLWNAVFALLPNPKCGPFELRVLCQDSLRRGSFAKSLATYFEEVDCEELFVAGLLQDMAIPILAQLWPKEYESILTQHAKTGVRISSLEQETFGLNHADAGAFLVQEWGFGDELADSILKHIQNNPESSTEKEAVYHAIVSLSSFLPSVLDKTWNSADLFFDCIQQTAIGKNKGVKIDETFAKTDEIFGELLSMMQMERPVTPMVEYYKKYVSS